MARSDSVSTAPHQADASVEPDLRELLDRWRGPVVGMLRANRSKRPVELAHDTFAELWLKRDRFEGDWADDRAVGAWLLGIARNLAARERTQLARAAQSLEESGADASDAGSTAERIQRNERAARIRAALDQLPDDLRIPLVMQALEGTPVRQVAALLELPEKTVEGRLYRARKELARRLSGDGQEVAQ